MIGALVVVAQLQILAHAPATAMRCDPIDVSVAVESSTGHTPSIRPVALGSFDVLRSSPSPHVTDDPRTGRSLAEFTYTITTGQTGALTVGPFEATVDGQTVRSAPLRIDVRPIPDGMQTPQVIARARIDTGFALDLRSLAHPETVYVGQQANYEVAVFLNQAVRDRMRRNPTFFPPDMRSMLAYDLPLDAARRTSAGARCFDALVYQRALFPLFPGRLSIPPAQLVYSLPLSISYFSQEESHELETDSTIVVAIDPPQAGRPTDYVGAVGQLTASARVDDLRARVGDPLVLTLRVSGTGNVKLLPRPPVTLPWASVVDGDERVMVDTTARRVRGTKEFDWLVTPRVAGELDLPPIRYPYFDPDARQYQVATTGAVALHVAAGTLARADTALDRPLGIRTAYRDPPAPPATQRPWYWAVLALAPVPALRRRWRLRARPRHVARSAASVLRALPQGRAVDPCALRRAYVGAFAERLGVEAQRFTRPGSLAHALRRAGVSANAARDAERFLRVLDEAAYSPSGVLPPNAQRTAATLFEAADREALPRVEVNLPTGAVALLLAVAIAAVGAAAIAATPARTNFDRGVAEYAIRRFAPATRAFTASVQADDRSPDAWANLGTAAWGASDTALAVLGWQRALRLEPDADDVRDRLDLVHPIRLGMTGYVPPLPRDALALVALALWVFGWLATAAPRRFRIDGMRTSATGAIVLGASLLLVALDVQDRAAARRLGVVRTTHDLVSAPALGSEADGSVSAGEMAEVQAREGAWTRVTLDGGREGWLPSDVVLPVSSLPPTN